MLRNAKKFLVLTVGIIFIVLGLAGLVLPFLQGIIFLIIGLLLVSLCFPNVRFWIKRRTERHKHMSATVEKIETWLAKFIGNLN